MPVAFYDPERGAPFFEVHGAHNGRTRVYYVADDPKAKKMALKQARIMERTAVLYNAEPMMDTSSFTSDSSRGRTPPRSPHRP